MKGSSLLLALTAAISVSGTAVAQADTYNKVTLSGRIVSATQPVVKNATGFTSSTQKLVARGITNSSILDLLYARADIPSKQGFTIIEFMDNDGNSTAYAAFNTKTGQTVIIDSSIFTGLSNARYVTAETSSVRTSPQAVTRAETSVNTGTGLATMFGTPVSVYFNSTTQMKYTDKVQGTGYKAVNYSALLRGVSSTNELLDAKVVSNGTLLVPVAK